MTTPTPPPPGWYPHQGALRWWDGIGWTVHVQPLSPARPAAPPVVIHQVAGRGYAVKGVSGSEHMLHAFATLLTCGLWLPVWIIRSLAGRQRHVPK